MKLQKTTVRPRSRVPSRVTSSFAACVTIALCSAALGCGSVAEGDVEDLGTDAEALLPEAWRNFGHLTNTKAKPHEPLSSSNVSFPIADEPIAFSTVPLMSTVAVRNSSDKKYYLRTIITYNDSLWAKFDGKAFSSPPAATHFAYYSDGSFIPNPYSFVIAGKHTSAAGSPDSAKIFAMVGTAYDGSDSANPQPPTAGSWVQVGTQVYSNPGEGYPALSTSGSRIVMALRAFDSSPGVSQQRIFTFHRSTSAAGSWSSRISAPLFPSGMVPVGTPALAYLKDAEDSTYANKFVIMTRLQSGALAWILYNPSAINPWGSWFQAFITTALTSEPAVDWDPTHKIMTLYYKITNGDGQTEVVNTSVPNPGGLGAYPFYFIDQLGDATLHGSPRATMGGGREVTRRMLVFRGYTPSTPVDERDRTIIYAQDIPSWYPPLW
jgi:hypothetical protein